MSMCQCLLIRAPAPPQARMTTMDAQGRSMRMPIRIAFAAAELTRLVGPGRDVFLLCARNGQRVQLSIPCMIRIAIKWPTLSPDMLLLDDEKKKAIGKR